MRHLRTFFVCIIFIAFGTGVSAQVRWTTYYPFGENAWNSCITVAVDPNGDVWVGGYEGAARLDGDIWTRFTEDNGLASNFVYSIAIGSDGVVWVGGYEGVSRLESEVWTTFTEDDGLVGGYINDIAIGHDGTVWVSGGEWLYMYNDGIWIPSTPDLAPTNLGFGDMAVDSDGVVWLPAGRYGVYLYYDGLWMKFDDEERTYYSNNMSVAIDSDGMVWVGRTTGRIDRFNGETWTTILEGDRGASSLNSSHSKSKDYLNMLISMEQDYYSVHGKYVDFDFGEYWEPIGWPLPGNFEFEFEFEFSYQDTIAIAREVEDINRDGDTADGLTLSISNVQGSIEGSNLTWAPLIVEGPKNFTVNSIAIEPGGALWFGSSGGGLHRYKDGTWTSYTTEEGLVGNTVRDVAIAPDGTVWAATENGVSKFVPSTTIVEMDNNTPSKFAVIGNFPNPFNPETTIQFTLPEDGVVNLAVYNIMGQKVRELVADRMQAGIHSVIWDGKDAMGNAVSSGIYLSRLISGENVAANRMLLLK